MLHLCNFLQTRGMLAHRNARHAGRKALSRMLLVTVATLLAAANAGADGPYRRIRITQPADGQTLRNIEGTLDVSVEIEPALESGDVIDAVLDGDRKGLASRGTAFELSDVYRGTHRLRVVVLDADGRVVGRSSEIEFFVHQTSLLNPNNPNTSPPGPSR